MSGQLSASDLAMGHAQTFAKGSTLIKLWREHGVYLLHIFEAGEIKTKDTFNTLYFARRAFNNETRKLR
jgi:hypothetical protein